VTASKALLGGVLAVGSFPLFSSAAQAASARLSYSAPEGCPAEGAFVAAVEARGASLERAGQARVFDVRIEHAPGGFSGSFQVGEGSDASGARRVHGSSCAEVSDALAVVAAIALEGAAETSAVVAPSDSPSPDTAPPVAAPVTVSVAPPPVVSAVALSSTPVEPPAPTLKTVMGKDKVDVPAGQLSLGYSLRYTLSGGAALGVIPQMTLPRLDFSMARANLVSAPGDQDFVLGGVFRVRWSFLGPGYHHAPGFDTRVIGIKTQNKTMGIGTASLEGHLQYSLGSALYLDLNLGGEMWVGKVSAERPDGSQLFHSSLFNAYALAGLGLRF
jgi:hypothetical protein